MARKIKFITDILLPYYQKKYPCSPNKEIYDRMKMDGRVFYKSIHCTPKSENNRRWRKGFLMSRKEYYGLLMDYFDSSE